MIFGLISEGVSDRPVIEASLISFFAKQFPDITPLINPLQPKGKMPGGWTRVLAYCATEEFRGAFAFTDYVIIQIDTDKHLEKGYDVREQQSAEELIVAIQERIIQSIGAEFYDSVKKRVLFAVSLETIECWLLPFYSTNNAHKSKTKSCCKTLNQYLKKYDYTIDCSNSEGSYEYYQKAALILSKKKNFYASYSYNKSLEYFFEKELAKISPQ